jgi:hypothetical protein
MTGLGDDLLANVPQLPCGLLARPLHAPAALGLPLAVHGTGVIGDDERQLVLFHLLLREGNGVHAHARAVICMPTIGLPHPLELAGHGHALALVICR